MARPCLVPSRCHDPVRLCGVIRHTERADATLATVDGVAWSSTEDFLFYPVDPPLSDQGVVEAQRLAQDVATYVAGCSANVHVVVSSPYFRCVQTAVQICKRLGPRARMLIDVAVSEVFGPQYYGEIQPASPGRPLDCLLQHCSKAGVNCRSYVLGQHPAWGESLFAARQRFATRFLAYLKRNSQTRRNFLIVTHAECVAAALSVMPSHAGFGVESVEYGGMFLAQRPVATLRGVPSCEEDSGASPLGDESEPDLPDEAAAKDERSDSINVETGWQVHHTGVKVSRGMADTVAYESRVRRLADNTELSRLRVEQLLGVLPDCPLGSGGEVELNRCGAAQVCKQSSCGASTLLFGAEGSEVPSIVEKAPHKRGGFKVTLSKFPLWGQTSAGKKDSALLRSGSSCSSIDREFRQGSSGSSLSLGEFGDLPSPQAGTVGDPGSPKPAEGGQLVAMAAENCQVLDKVGPKMFLVGMREPQEQAPLTLSSGLLKRRPKTKATIISL